MSRPQTPSGDTTVGMLFRVVLIPIATLIVAVASTGAVLVAGSVGDISDQVHDTSVLVAEIHADTAHTDRRLDALEDDSRECKDRIHGCESNLIGLAATIAAMP